LKLQDKASKKLKLPLSDSETQQADQKDSKSPKEKENKDKKLERADSKARSDDRTSERRDTQQRDTQLSNSGGAYPVLNYQPMIPGAQGFFPFYAAPIMSNYVQASHTSSFVPAGGMILTQTLPTMTPPMQPPYMIPSLPSYMPPGYQQQYIQQAPQYQNQPYVQQNGQYINPIPFQSQPPSQNYHQQQIIPGSDTQNLTESHHLLAQGTQTSGVFSPSHRVKNAPVNNIQASEVPRQENNGPVQQIYQRQYFQQQKVEQQPAQNGHQQSSHTLSYTNSHPTPSFGQFGGAGGSQHSSHIPNQGGNFQKSQHKEANIFRQESFHNGNVDKKNPQETHNHNYKSFREVFTDSTTAVYGNPGHTVQESPYGQVSPLFRGANGGSAFQQSGIADRSSHHMGDMTKENTMKELFNTPSRSDIGNSRLSAKAGQSAYLNRSSAAYDSLLSRRKQALNNSNQSVTTSGRFPRMKSKKFVYFDLDEATFDKDKSGDNIHIE
jgi:hypothetical protein